MDPARTALLLVGFQNDYMAPDGVLREVVEDPAGVDAVRERTMGFIRSVADTDLLIISTPMLLTPDYRALASPVGILNAIREAGAFRAGTPGSESVADLVEFGDRIRYVGGREGFNAFSDTRLEAELLSADVRDVLVTGMVTSLCIDSTGRAAYERGYDVTVLSDCTTGRTATEHQFFCESVFPLYGRAATSTEVLEELDSVLS